VASRGRPAPFDTRSTLFRATQDARHLRGKYGRHPYLASRRSSCVVRDGIRNRLDREEDLTVVGEAANGERCSIEYWVGALP